MSPNPAILTWPYVAPAGPSWAPTDLTDLRVWLDAADTSTITDSGGVVSAWADKSGNGHNWTDAGGTGPTTGVDTLNGKNVLTHDAYYERLVGAATVKTTVATPVSVWVARTVVAGSTAGVLMPTQSTSSYRGTYQDGSTSSTASSFTATDYVNGVEFTGNRDDLHTLVSGSTFLFRVHGTISVEAWPTAYNNASFYAVGGIAEIVIAQNPSAAEISATDTYLMTKWGIS